MGIINPFEVTPEEIEHLDVLGMVRLLNTLLLDEGVRLGVPVSQVKITEHIYSADGGIDAIVVDTRSATVERGSTANFIDPGLTIVQYKKSWPGPAKMKVEVAKSKVQAAFQKGANYLLILGTGFPAPSQTEYEETLREMAEEVGCFGTVRLLVPEHISSWASRVPSAQFALRPQIREYFQASAFLEREERHHIPFAPDAQRRETIAAIRSALFGDSPSSYHARISGPAGVGKTRIALELVHDAGLAHLTLYCQNVPSRDLFAWVASKEDVWATVIVDECDDSEALQLETAARQCEGRMRLITVGVGASKGEDVYGLSPLGRSAAEQVVRQAGPTLPDEQVRWIAASTEGYVKLAVVVSRAVTLGRTNIVELRSDREVRHEISRILLPDSDERRAIQGVALLNRVGWRDDVAEEGRAISAFIGLEWSHMRHLLGRLQAEGLVVTKGRYWYVSPDLLAVWLAADFWEHQADRVLELEETLPTLGARASLQDRLAQLGGTASVHEVLEVSLGLRGPFLDLASLDNPRWSRLFATFAKGVPQAALAALERIVGYASHEELLTFRSGRRDVVWTMERLLERRDTFFGAARLLRRLAEAENEEWTNNATGVWQSIFLTFLAPTEVPALDRFVLLEEALDAEPVAMRILAVRGLEAALESREIGLPLRDHVSLPLSHWHPGTWGDVWAAKRRALTLLDRAIQDPDPEVRREACRAFFDHARDLVQIHLVDEVIGRYAHIDAEDEAERRRIWESILDILKYDSSRLNEEQRQRLEQAAKRFYGNSLADRIKRYVGSHMPREWPIASVSNAPSPNEVLRSLGDEAFASPDELQPVLPWLVSDQAVNVRPFGRRLGELDAEHRFLEQLLSTAKAGSNPQILGAYLVGRSEAGEAEWREQLLDEWSEGREFAEIVLDATLVGRPSERGIARLFKLIDRGWLAVRVLGWLRYGPSMEILSADAVCAAVTRLLAEGSPPSLEAGLELVARWADIEGNVQTRPLEDLTWQLLEHPGGWGRGPMLVYAWTEVAEHLVANDPVRVARLVIRSFVEGEASLGDKRLNVLVQAITAAPQEVWEAIGEFLLDKSRSYRFSWIGEEYGLVHHVPDELVIGWIGKHGAAGARTVAALIRPHGEELPEVVRFLLREYGDEVDGYLAGNVTSGGWSGSEAAYVAGKLETARKWLHDPEPAIRQWAQKLVASLERWLERARISDEEDTFM